MRNQFHFALTNIFLTIFQHEQFTVKHQQNPEKLRELVNSIARAHHLNVPIRKTTNWIFNQITESFKIAYSECNAKALIEKVGAESFQKFDPQSEVKELIKHVEKLKSPSVLCHFDLRSSNILVRKSDQKVLLVDFEYSTYGPRGTDLASFINDWGHEPFEVEKKGLPADEVLEMFAQLYIEECSKIVPNYADKPENTLNTVVKEIKVMHMVLYMFYLSFMMKSKQSLIAAIPFDPKANMVCFLII